MNNDIPPPFKTKHSTLRTGAGVKILIGIWFIGASIGRIVYGSPMNDPNQEIGAKIAVLAILIAGIYLIVSGVKSWNKN
jgi:hypothetical protein